MHWQMLPLFFSQVTLKQLCQNGTGLKWKQCWYFTTSANCYLQQSVTICSTLQEACFPNMSSSKLNYKWDQSECIRKITWCISGGSGQTRRKSLVWNEKKRRNLYNLGKGRYQWHLSIYLQIYLQHNITTISKQCSIKMWYLVVFSPSFISGISHCNLQIYLYFRNEWDYFPTFMQEEMWCVWVENS